MNSILNENSDVTSNLHEEEYRTIILRQREELRITIATSRQNLVEAQNENDKLRFEIEDLKHENASLRRGALETSLSAQWSCQNCRRDGSADSDDELLLSGNRASASIIPKTEEEEDSSISLRSARKRQESTVQDYASNNTPKRRRVEVLVELNDTRRNRSPVTEPQSESVASSSSLEIKENREIPQYAKTKGVVISPAMAASLFRFEELVAFPQDDSVFIPLVSRTQLNNFYGGGSFKFVQYIRKKEAGNLRGRMLIFPARAPTLTQHLPDRAGSHGLTFGSKRAIETAVNGKKTCSLFLPSTGPDSTLFEYYGDYRLSFCGHLSKEQFAGQEKKVQMSIVQDICDDRSATHNFMVARVGLRKRGVALTDTNVVEEAKMVAKRKKNSTASFRSDVLEALLSGQERVAIVRLRCVGFDKAFVKDLIKRINGENQDPGSE